MAIDRVHACSSASHDPYAIACTATLSCLKAVI